MSTYAERCRIEYLNWVEQEMRELSPQRLIQIECLARRIFTMQKLETEIQELGDMPMAEGLRFLIDIFQEVMQGLVLDVFGGEGDDFDGGVFHSLSKKNMQGVPYPRMLDIIDAMRAARDKPRAPESN